MSKEKVLEKLDLNKLEAKEGVITIVHQTLETPKMFYDKAVKLNGTIEAPANFFEKRESEHPKLKCHVLYNYRKGTIKFVTEENREINYEVSGMIKQNPDMLALGINTGKIMGVTEMSKLVRMNKLFFADKDENLVLVSNLQKFRANAQVEIEQMNDQKGNVRELYEIKASQNLKLDFDLLMPVFVGQPNKKFRVEICFAVRDRNIDFWLESVELNELLNSDLVSIIDEQLTRFKGEVLQIETNE